MSPVCRRQDIMAPPQPSADTKPVKSQDDYINHGREQLMSFLMTLRAIAIYGIATDWHDFDDAARVHAQDDKGTRAVLNFVRRFGQRSERTTAAAEDKYNAMLLLIKVGVNILDHLETLKAQEKIVAWHQQRATNFVFF